MLYFTIILLMAILSMASGASLPGSNLLNKKGEVSSDTGEDKGGIMPFNLTFLPELLFAVVIGFCAMRGYENFGFDAPFGWAFSVWIMATAWAYIWMQTGHAAILPWDKADKLETKSRDNTLTPFVIWFCDLVGITHIEHDGDREHYTEAYVWTFTGIKGFLMALPVGGVINAILWPLGYEIGSHAKNHLRGKVSWDLHMVSEGASGAGAGIACVAWLAFTAWIGG